MTRSVRSAASSLQRTELEPSVLACHCIAIPVPKLDFSPDGLFKLVCEAQCLSLAWHSASQDDRFLFQALH